jgi:uncharacterized membrane protein YuzA (DUF378 family)
MSDLLVYAVIGFIGLYFVAGVLDTAKGQPRTSSGQYQTWRTNQIMEITLSLLVMGAIFWIFVL